MCPIIGQEQLSMDALKQKQAKLKEEISNIKQIFDELYDYLNKTECELKEIEDKQTPITSPEAHHRLGFLINFRENALKIIEKKQPKIQIEEKQKKLNEIETQLSQYKSVLGLLEALSIPPTRSTLPSNTM